MPKTDQLSAAKKNRTRKFPKLRQPIKIEREKTPKLREPIRIEYYVNSQLSARVEVASRLMVPFGFLCTILIHMDLDPPTQSAQSSTTGLTFYFTVVGDFLTFPAITFYGSGQNSDPKSVYVLSLLRPGSETMKKLFPQNNFITEQREKSEPFTTEFV